MREKRLKLFLYDLGMNYNGNIVITDNLIFLLTSFIRTTSTEEEFKLISLIFKSETGEENSKIKFTPKELVELNEELAKERLEDIIEGLSDNEIFAVGVLASNFINYIHEVTSIMYNTSSLKLNMKQ